MAALPPLCYYGHSHVRIRGIGQSGMELTLCLSLPSSRIL